MWDALGRGKPRLWMNRDRQVAFTPVGVYKSCGKTFHKLLFLDAVTSSNISRCSSRARELNLAWGKICVLHSKSFLSQ
jgi:hypothetical protein